jgi:hypothetical protein
VDITDHTKAQTQRMPDAIVTLSLPTVTAGSETAAATAGAVGSHTISAEAAVGSETATPAADGGGAGTPSAAAAEEELVTPSEALASVRAKAAVVGKPLDYEKREEWLAKAADRLAKKAAAESSKPVTKATDATTTPTPGEKPEWPELTPQEAQLWDLLSDPADRRKDQKRRPDDRFTFSPHKPRTHYEVTGEIPDPDDF